jgi:hypothetical protein
LRPQLRKARALVGAILVLSASVSPLLASQLQPETIRAWIDYIAATEARIDSEISSEGPFLRQEISPGIDSRKVILAGNVWVTRMETRNVEGKKIPIPSGRIHHWVGAVLIRNAELSDVLDWLRDCDNFEAHFDEVERSLTLGQEGDVVRCFLRVRGKKVQTVHYHTEQTIRYRRLGAEKATSRTEATRIVQLKDPGTPKESEMPEGNDNGYLWRWNSYWRFKAEGAHVLVECETVSLSRSVPKVFWWFVKPFLTSVPKEYLESALSSLRDAIESRAPSGPR